jgi:hypothetical protein
MKKGGQGRTHADHPDRGQVQRRWELAAPEYPLADEGRFEKEATSPSRASGAPKMLPTNME